MYLGCTCLSSTFLDEIETLELSETLEELHDLFISQVGRQATDIDLVGRILHGGGDDTGDMHRSSGTFWADVVLGSSDFEGDALEDNAVKGHRSRGFLRRSELI
jgi:hypothetical protein